ncbi:hypothetical protein D3C81_2198410 [compost metagenome]
MVGTSRVMVMRSASMLRHSWTMSGMFWVTVQPPRNSVGSVPRPEPWLIGAMCRKRVSGS